MARSSGPAGGTAVVIALMLALSVASCSGTTRTRVLSTFFDGVPPATERTPDLPKREAKPKPQPSVATAPAAAAEPVPASAPVIPPAPLEAMTTWDQVMTALPVVQDGGVDWARAFERGLVTPKFLGRPVARKEAPQTLDTLMNLATDDPRRPAFDLDVRITPTAIAEIEAAKFYEVRFPHSSHTAWLGCSSCHPGVTSSRTGMRGILEGQYCGRCHGRVSFAPEVSCSRCHVNLNPPSPDHLIEEVSDVAKQPADTSPEVVARGALVFRQMCAVCHGESGDGAGPLSPSLQPKPRDFTAGKYKFRTTLPTSIPTDLDIFTTITRGVPGTSMPAFSALPREDRWALTHFVKTLSKKFVDSKPEPIPIEPPPEVTPELIEMGRTLYVEAGCNLCHGDMGRGNGPSAATLKDDWGNPLRPFNFASGRPLKGGSGREAVYRAVMTGLQGTPMPGFGDSLEPQQGWALASYVQTFFGQAPQPFAVKGDVTFVRSDAALASPDAKNYPPVVFPHWFHRIRAKCVSCHPAPFEMRAGANAVSMDKLRSGQFCATCHNGKTAWEIGFKTCVKCHVAPGT